MTKANLKCVCVWGGASRVSVETPEQLSINPAWYADWLICCFYIEHCSFRIFLSGDTPMLKRRSLLGQCFSYEKVSEAFNFLSHVHYSTVKSFLFFPLSHIQAC